MKKINYVSYEDALTDNEILLYSQIVDQFKNGEIDFTILKSLFLNCGVTIEVKIKDFSKSIRRISKANTIKQRVLEENYLYNDIDYFILNSDEFKNVVFRIDYKAIEVLANFGIPEYQKKMISILMTQIRLSGAKDENSVIKIKKWQRRIQELELELSSKKSINKLK